MCHLAKAWRAARGGLPVWAAWGYRTDFCVISVGFFSRRFRRSRRWLMACGRMPGRSAALSGHINPEVSFASFVGLWDREPRQPVFKVFTGFCQNRTLNSSAQVDFFHADSADLADVYAVRHNAWWAAASIRKGYRTDFCVISVISVGFFTQIPQISQMFMPCGTMPDGQPRR